MCKLPESKSMQRMPIIISPKYTRATFMTGMAADHLYEWARAKGLNPIRISGFRTRKPIVRKELWLADMQPKPLLLCFDESTEVLTANGFKFFKDISYGDLVATLTEGGYIEYHHPYAIQKYVYSGDMVHINGKGIDLLVTPEHNLYVEYGDDWRKHKEGFQFITASSFYKEYYPSKFFFKRNAAFMGIDVDIVTEEYLPTTKFKPHPGFNYIPKNIKDIPIDTFLKFFGWYITEGWCGQDKRGNYRICIVQKKENYRREIMQVLRDMGLKASVTISRQGVHFMEVRSKQLGEYLSQFGKSHDKFIPPWIKNLPPDKLRILIFTMAKGDGNFRPNHNKYDNNVSICYTTISKYLADDLQEMCLKAGYVSTACFNEERKIYNVVITNSHGVVTLQKKPVVEQYSGMVYDLTVPNHTLFVRRNGKCVWSGNCYIGHGLNDCWIGMEDMRARLFRRKLIKMGANEDWLEKDAIIHTISCYTMKELGPHLIQKGVRCYFGSSEKMLVNPIDNKIEPATVPDFVDIFTIGQKYIMMGATCEQALAAYYARCDMILRNYENSGLLEKSRQLKNAYYAIKINRDFFTAVGDTSTQWVTSEELTKMLTAGQDNSVSAAPKSQAATRGS